MTTIDLAYHRPRQWTADELADVHRNALGDLARLHAETGTRPAPPPPSDTHDVGWWPPERRPHACVDCGERFLVRRDLEAHRGES